ncbi:MAG TPA: adenosine-specific kinase, partial [Thermodesulfovibrionales bacterium]|nr:adenosine-specific kinase [Thermodesulfovibrionales bacterium]
MELKIVKMEIPEGCNIILGQTHFIKTAEDLYEVIATTVPQAKFGIAFTEASGPCLIRTEGNDGELINSCVKN